MEPIKAAIERARHQRNSGEAPGFKKRSPASAAPVPNDEALTGIEYTHTFQHQVSRDDLAANRVIAQEKRHAFADAYRMLRTQVLSKLRDNGWTTLGVTSAGAGQGKTLTATNLAISMARNVKHTVLLADFDLRRPNVRNLFNYEREGGLIDCIERGLPVEDVLFTPDIDGLVVLPGGEAVDESSELLGTARVSGLVQELRDRYQNRIVIFDLPPLLVTDDVFEIMPQLDSLLFVVEEGKTRRDEVARCMDLLEGKNLIGTILNKSRDSQSSYGYQTPYY
ncbi:MAG TPA: exopolysaccharide biosynthesis protein [Gammaproteobacteria bacterium]|nr:exopolysaccharide biosynthesis protein [Gammaproteobacteria bacterium]